MPDTAPGPRGVRRENVSPIRRPAGRNAAPVECAAVESPAAAPGSTAPPGTGGAPAATRADPRKAAYEANKLRKRLCRQVGEAIADYAMIEDGDRVPACWWRRSFRRGK